MILEQYKDFVYFSKWLKADYPIIYKELTEILDANRENYDILQYTKDYWCRDYMPIKTDAEAFSQIQALYPQYRERIYQVQMASLIERWGGALNCCTWTIRKKFDI